MPPFRPAAGWDLLSDRQQVEIAYSALQFALGSVAEQADVLAHEMEQGALLDRGGPDALRLLATVLRQTCAIGSPQPQPQDLAHLTVAGRA